MRTRTIDPAHHRSENGKSANYALVHGLLVSDSCITFRGVDLCHCGLILSFHVNNSIYQKLRFGTASFTKYWVVKELQEDSGTLRVGLFVTMLFWRILRKIIGFFNPLANTLVDVIFLMEAANRLNNPFHSECMLKKGGPIYNLTLKFNSSRVSIQL